jgi:hypothetical protein
MNLANSPTGSLQHRAPPSGGDFVLTESCLLHEEIVGSAVSSRAGTRPCNTEIFKSRNPPFGSRAHHASPHAGVTAVLSPDETILAVLDGHSLALASVHAGGVNPWRASSPGGVRTSFDREAVPACTVRRFSACLPPMPSKARGRGQPAEPVAAYETLLAACWSPDSSRLVLAAGSGSIYTLDRHVHTRNQAELSPQHFQPLSAARAQSLTSQLPSPCSPSPRSPRPSRDGALICAIMPEKQPFPWASAGGCAALAMPTEDRMLMLTPEALLFTLPMASAVASSSTFAALRPMNLRVSERSVVCMRACKRCRCGCMHEPLLLLSSRLPLTAPSSAS